MYPTSIPIIICVLSSAEEALAISRNLAFSLSEALSMPSAIFDGMDKLDQVT